MSKRYLLNWLYIDRNITYLVYINANTKYAMIKPTNELNGHGIYLTANTRGVIPYLDTLEKMRKEVEKTNPIIQLKGSLRQFSISLISILIKLFFTKIMVYSRAP